MPTQKVDDETPRSFITGAGGQCQGRPPEGGGKHGFTALALWLVLRSMDLGRLGAIVRRADFVQVGFAVLYTVALFAIEPLRWLWLKRPVFPEATYGVAQRSLLVGAGARLVLLSKVGKVARVLVVPRVVVAMTFKEPSGEGAELKPLSTSAPYVAVALATTAVLLIGMLPGRLWGYASRALMGF